MNKAVWKGSRSNHYTVCKKVLSYICSHTFYLCAFNNKPFDHTLLNVNILFRLHSLSHIKPVQASICLCSCCLNGRPFSCIQSSKLNCCGIGCLSHLSAKGVNLFYKMTLSNSSDGWITRHKPYGVYVCREHKGFASHTR